MAYAFVRDRFVDAPQASVSIAERGFRFADGVFETLRVEGGVPYQWEWHLERLQAGLAALRIAYDGTLLKTQCLELLRRNAVQDGMLRIYISRGEGGQGYLPERGAAPCIVIETRPFPARPEGEILLWLSGVEKISCKALPTQYKLAQGLNSTLARMEAQEHGCFEALQLNAQGEIAECSSANIFWLKGDVLYTPALDCGALQGSTRAAVLRLSPWRVDEGRFPLTMLREAEAVFITNTAFQVLPVTALHPQEWRWSGADECARIHVLLKEDVAAYARAHNADEWKP